MQVKTAPRGELAKAMAKLETELRDGLKHGFFDFTITCRTLNKNDRELVIKAGKNYRYTIPEDEVDSQ